MENESSGAVPSALVRAEQRWHPSARSGLSPHRVHSVSPLRTRGRRTADSRETERSRPWLRAGPHPSPRCWAATHRPPAPRRPAPGTSSPSGSPSSRSSTAGNGQSPPKAGPGTRTCRAWLLTRDTPRAPARFPACPAGPDTAPDTAPPLPAAASGFTCAASGGGLGAGGSRPGQLPQSHGAPCGGRT